MIRLLAFDPGERFCGYAILDGHVVVATGVDNPNDFVDWFLGRMAKGVAPPWTHVVGEEWRNYDGGEATWSTCATAEILGVVRHACRRRNMPFYTQPARIKKPGFARMRYRGIEMPVLRQIPSSDRQHAKDAIVHGHKWQWDVEDGKVLA